MATVELPVELLDSMHTSCPAVSVSASSIARALAMEPQVILADEHLHVDCRSESASQPDAPATREARISMLYITHASPQPGMWRTDARAVRRRVVESGDSVALMSNPHTPTPSSSCPQRRPQRASTYDPVEGCDCGRCAARPIMSLQGDAENPCRQHLSCGQRRDQPTGIGALPPLPPAADVAARALCSRWTGEDEH